MSKHLRLSLLAAVFAAFALALAACGSGDEESDEEQITTAIESSIRSTDPEECGAFTTQAFMEQAEMEQGAAAVEACEEDVEDTSNDPDSIEITKVKAGDGKATAVVAFDGGSLDGQTVNVSLVEEDGDWKLDRVESFVVFDRETFVDAIEGSFAPGDLTTEQSDCVREALKFAEYEQLEAFVLSGNEDALVEVLGDC